ncbi:MAG: DUF3102 domain-containing protein [Xanthobacteraceae bacterium]
MNNVASNLTALARQDDDLTQHAEAIRGLVAQIRQDVVEIGRRLTECKEIAGHGRWSIWLDEEFGWSHSTALNFMSVFQVAQSKNVNFANLKLPLSALYLLAAPNTPPAVQDEFIERAQNGDVISLAEVKQAITSAEIGKAVSISTNRHEAKRLDRLQRVAGALWHNTECLAEFVDLPDLSSKAAQTALAEIRDAVVNLRAFEKRLTAKDAS